MITPDMLTWKPYTTKDDGPMVLGYIECTAREPDGLLRKYTYCISKDYALMGRAYDYFWYIVGKMTHAMCTEYYEKQRLDEYDWWKRNSSMFA